MMMMMFVCFLFINTSSRFTRSPFSLHVLQVRMTRATVTRPVSTGLLLVSPWRCGTGCCCVCCTDVTATASTSVWEVQRWQRHHPDHHHRQCSVYRHRRNYSRTIRVHLSLIVCWRPLWVYWPGLGRLITFFLKCRLVLRGWGRFQRIKILWVFQEKSARLCDE